jgi:Zn-dependent peptidase ImmA (M78 family)
MHRQPVLHQDKPLDGSAAGNTRDAVELEADKFATHFLMPAKQVKGIFRQLFLTDKFVINENMVFSLTGGGVSAFRQKCKSLRDLSRILAEAGSNAGESFKSMAGIFNVSKETMAIRLKELQLVEF